MSPSERWLAGLSAVFVEYGSETFEKVWQSLIKNYNQVLRAWGGNRGGSWRQQ